MAESGEPIEHPTVYRSVVFAFAVWSAHFIVAYGAVLIFPGQPSARWIAIAAAIAAVGALTVWTVLQRPAPRLGLAAVGLALAAIVLGTFPAIVG